jgi:hypothetical protein
MVPTVGFEPTSLDFQSNAFTRLASSAKFKIHKQKSRLKSGAVVWILVELLFCNSISNNRARLLLIFLILKLCLCKSGDVFCVHAFILCGKNALVNFFSSIFKK